MAHFEWLKDLFDGRMQASQGLVSYAVDVTPLVAQKLLELNFDHNRKLRKANVSDFAVLIENGEFFPGSQVRIGSHKGYYTLLDGQHRLTAIAQTGCPQPMVITVVDIQTATGVREDYARLDTNGQRRTMGDALFSLDAQDSIVFEHSKLTALGSAVRLLLGGNTLSSQSLKKVPKMAIYRWIKKNNEPISALRECVGTGMVGTTRGIIKSPVLSVALATFECAPRDKAVGFWRQVVEDDGLGKSDPRKKLHEFLARPMSGGKASLVAQAVTARCWNAYVSGKSMGNLDRSTAMPKIALTPYPRKVEEPEED